MIPRLICSVTLDGHFSCPCIWFSFIKQCPAFPQDLLCRANELTDLNVLPQGRGNSTTRAVQPGAPTLLSTTFPTETSHSLRICFLISLEGSSQF